MHTGGRLVAGSHNRNEFVLINADENGRVTSLSLLNFIGFLGLLCPSKFVFYFSSDLFFYAKKCPSLLFFALSVVS